MNRNLLLTDVKNINYLMTYDRSKTINEQKPDNLMPYQPDNPRYKKPDGSMDIEKQSRDLKELDIHTLNQVLAIGTFFIPIVGPFISLGFELLDAGFYAKEGDKEMAGLSFAFSLLPMGELLRMVPSVKKYGKKWLLNAVKKAKNGKPVTVTERRAIRSIVENTSQIKKIAKRQLLKKTLQTAFKGLSLTQKIGLMYKLGRTYNLFNIFRFGLTIGGVYYSYYKLAEIFGWIEDKNKDEVKIKKIESEFTSEEDKKMQNFVKELLDVSEEESQKAMEIILKSAEKIKTEKPPTKRLKKSTTEDWIRNLESGNWILTVGSEKNEQKPGYEGVKKLIKKIRICLELPPKDVFDFEMKDKVKKIQSENNLKDDGIIGKDTFKLLSDCVKDIKPQKKEIDNKYFYKIPRITN